MDSAEPILTSVALCTHNHADRLVRTLEDLKKLVRPTRSWELIVVDNASTDKSPEILAEQGWKPSGVRTTVVRELRLGLSNARNRAVKEARGKYILFIDDDETPDPDWLARYEIDMLAHTPDALGGRIEVLFENGIRPLWLQEDLLGFLGRLNYGEPRWLTERGTPFYGGNFAIKKDVLEKIGQFDSDLGRKGRVNAGGEDTDFYRRLIDSKLNVRWVPGAIIYHRIRANKLRRSYFLELHYRQGLAEGSRKRANTSRIPPKYLFGQLVRAIKTAVYTRFTKGKDYSLRSEMNAVYFCGYIAGWVVYGRSS